MKKFKAQIFILVLFLFGMVLPALAAEFQFHGDMNNRFLLYTDRHDWLNSEQAGEINDSAVEKFYGELKYRFWVEAATDDSNIKGVYAIEIGGVRFGETGTGRGQGGSYSGDAANVETRWAYIDLQLPFVSSKARTLIGLQPFSVNRYIWQETAAGVNFVASPANKVDYQLAWMRGVDILKRTDSGIEDVDGFYAQVNFKPMDKTNIGVFGLYQTGDANNMAFGTITPRSYELKSFAGNVKHRLVTLGTEGNFNPGPFSLGWNLMYQGGEIDRATWNDGEFSGVTTSGNFDVSAYFFNLDVGTRIDKIGLKYRFWYASGDDDPSDKDFNGFISTDVDIDDSIAIFEGLYTDDDTYFTERPYILDKGLIMNRLSADIPVGDKSTFGLALMYMLTAEDIKYTDSLGRSHSNNEIGFELDGYWRYMLYKNIELSVNAGYLLAGDALDAFEVGALQDGNADKDIFGSSMRIRYKF